MNIPPIPTYDRELADFEKVYKSALVKIIKQLENVKPEDLLARQIYEAQIRQIVFIINDLNVEARAWIETTMTDSFEYAQASALVTMGLATSLVEAKGELQHSLMSRNRIEAMIADTFTDVLKAHSKMEESLKQMVRDVQAQVLQDNVAMQRGTVTSAKDIRAELLRQGFSPTLIEENWKGIVDARGNRWDLTTYSKMVARTKLQQAQLEGARVQARENENDLAIISSHGAKDACSNFEGMIISLEGKTKGYKTLAEVRASGLIFHPNCQHTVHPIGDVKVLPEKVLYKSSQAERKADDALSRPEEIKQQDNARRYKQNKERKEKIKEQRRKALEKAHKAKQAR